ncbi:MAG: glycosyltransferase family 4 protein [Anaerolineae bacterium]|nr:glycosyltransferase family 4 protein [Anaerolineae bacterium]
MNILLITLAYPPNHVGGTEMSTHTLARGLQQAGHNVQVICADGWYDGPHHWNGEIQDVYEGIPVTRLLINWKLAPDPCRYQYDNPLVGDYLHVYLSSARPDVVHVTSCIAVSAAALTAPASLGLPLVLTLTDFWFVCPRIKLITKRGECCDGHVAAWECLKCTLWGTKVYRWSSRVLPEYAVATMLRWVARQPSLSRQSSLIGQAFDIDHRRTFLKQALQQCDRIIVKSSYMRDVFAQHGVSFDKLVVLADGEDTSWGPAEASDHPFGVVRIGYIGHIIPPKGVHLLIQAMRQLTGPAELLIFGDLDHDPGYTDSLRVLAGHNGRIHFKGGFPHHRIGEVLSQIDVLVVPSTWPETFCHVVREGFIAQVPVIGANIGAIPEAIEPGVNGFLFSPGDVNDLSRYLQMIIDNPQILDQLRERIPKVKTIDQQVRELTNLYETLIL